MPYALQSSNGGWYVVNQATGKRHSAKPLPRRRAVAQMRALYSADPSVAHKAPWSTANVNDLPDSAFLFVEDGGTVADGKTTPRSLRHFPYRKANGEIDLPHLRNAIARIPQSNAVGLNKVAVQKRARELLAQAKVTTKAEQSESSRRAMFAKMGSGGGGGGGAGGSGDAKKPTLWAKNADGVRTAESGLAHEKPKKGDAKPEAKPTEHHNPLRDKSDLEVLTAADESVLPRIYSAFGDDPGPQMVHMMAHGAGRLGHELGLPAKGPIPHADIVQAIRSAHQRILDADAEIRHRWPEDRSKPKLPQWRKDEMEQDLAPILNAHVTTKAPNYNARAGQTISGNLKRGADGKFGSGGNPTVKPAGGGRGHGSHKRLTAADRAQRAAESETRYAKHQQDSESRYQAHQTQQEARYQSHQQQQAAIAAKKREQAAQAAQAKPKGGGGGGKGGSAKPAKTNPNTAILDALASLRDGTISPDDQQMLLSKGIIRKAPNGGIRLTARGLQAVSSKAFTLKRSRGNGELRAMFAKMGGGGGGVGGAGGGKGGNAKGTPAQAPTIWPKDPKTGRREDPGLFGASYQKRQTEVTARASARDQAKADAQKKQDEQAKNQQRTEFFQKQVPTAGQTAPKITPAKVLPPSGNGAADLPGSVEKPPRIHELEQATQRVNMPQAGWNQPVTDKQKGYLGNLLDRASMNVKPDSPNRQIANDIIRLNKEGKLTKWEASQFIDAMQKPTPFTAMRQAARDGIAGNDRPDAPWRALLASPTLRQDLIAYQLNTEAEAQGLPF